jgi:FTR1 family protein
MSWLGSLLEGFVVVLREGVEVALVIGILLAALRRTDRQRYASLVGLGVAAAVLASVTAGAVVRRWGLDAENPVFEGALKLAAAAMVGSLVVWMWRAGRSLRRRMERRLDGIVAVEGRRPALRAAAGVFAFAFLMVFREGVETVLFLLALAGTAPDAMSILLGSAAGLLLAVLLGVVLVRGSVRVNLRRFFAVTGAALLLLVLKLLAGGLHEFVEHGLVPIGPAGAALLEVLASRTISVAVLVVLVAAPLGMLAWDWRRKLPAQRALAEDAAGD